MAPSLLTSLAAGNTWMAIWPEAALGCLALSLLLLEILLPKGAQTRIPGIAIAGQLAVLVGIALDYHDRFIGQVTFDGLLLHSLSGQALRIFFVLSSILVSILAQVTLAKQTMPRIEFYAIVLVVTAAMMLLVQSCHFVMLFVALETVTVGLYILVGYGRTSARTLEAGLKYLIMGALSSALLLFGIVLLYGVAGNPGLPAHTASALQFGDLARFLNANPHNFLAGLGIVLVLSGVGFKIGAVPFQIWIPDVYEGAPTPVTAFLAVASKAAGFGILLGLVRYAFPAYAWLTTPVLGGMAAATILFGNLAALTQHNVKRLIGLSGVSHAGFLLVGVAAVSRAPLASGAVYFYLFAYLLASFAVFGVMAHLAGPDDWNQELEHYAGLMKENPFLGAVLAVGLGSLAGIPPLAGFTGKFLVFVAAYQAGLHWLLGIAITGVVISIYYYFGWIRAAFFDAAVPPSELSPRPARTPPAWGARVALLGLTLASILIGFYPSGLTHWLKW
jgi:NADH-quinone oxidoreductase subunit N